MRSQGLDVKVLISAANGSQLNQRFTPSFGSHSDFVKLKQTQHLLLLNNYTDEKAYTTGLQHTDLTEAAFRSDQHLIQILPTTALKKTQH